jgi:hypothetical protein
MNVHASRPESGFLARYPPALTSERLANRENDRRTFKLHISAVI